MKFAFYNNSKASVKSQGSCRSLSADGGMAIQGWRTGQSLYYLAYDTVYATTQGARSFFGSAAADKQIPLYVAKSGLFQAAKVDGWWPTVIKIPRQILETSLENLASGDPEKAGAFILDTALLVAPGPKLVAAIKNGARMGTPLTMMNMASQYGGLSPVYVGGTAAQVSAASMEAIAGAMVQESATMAGMSNVYMSGTRTGRQIWGKWDCKSCGETGISSRPKPNEVRKACPKCGAPKPEGTKDYLDGATDSKGRIIDDADDVKGPQEKKVANAGKDWSCPNCGGKNSALGTSCTNCGQSKTVALEEAARKAKNQPAPGTITNLTNNKNLIRGMGIAVPVVAGIGYYLLRTIEVPAVVVDKSWSRTLLKLKFVEATKRDWKSSISLSTPRMPVNGVGEIAGAFNIHNCSEEFHHNDRYVCGSHTETTKGSCSYTSNDNGTFDEHCSPDTSTTVDDYCDRPVDETKCDYQTYVWQRTDSRSVSGRGDYTGPLPFPEEMSLASDEKSVLNESFSSIVNYKFRDKPLTYDLSPQNEREYHATKINDAYVLKVNRLAVVGATKKP